MPNYKIGIDIDADDNASGNIKKVTGAAGSLDDAFAGANMGAGGLGASLGAMLNPATLATGALAAIGAAAVATGAHAMDLASQVEQSTALMTTQLGLTTEEAQSFEQTMRDVYAGNSGESFDDVAASLVAVEQAFGRIGGTENQEQLQAVTEQAIAFGDAFDKDVGESATAAVTLMENFGLTSTQAFDFLAAGMQRGLNASDDFLDTIGEYSVQFSQGGASGAEFFSILESGMQGGMLGTDKAADAFKEFNIRIQDNSTLTKDALSGIGISYDTLKQGFADGSVTQIDAMQMVIQKINEIEDPIARNTAGVALFGTQWEDLTDQVVTSIDTQKTGLEDLEGAAESLGDQYDTTGSKLAAATRQWDDALVDVGQELNSLSEFALPYLAGAVDLFIVPAIKVFVDWLEEVRGIITSIGGFLDMIGLLPDMPVTPPAASPSLPVTVPQAGASGFGGGSTQNYVQVYVERGDPEVVMQAASLGVTNAQRMRGE